MLGFLMRRGVSDAPAFGGAKIGRRAADERSEMDRLGHRECACGGADTRTRYDADAGTQEKGKLKGPRLFLDVEGLRLG